MCVAVVNALVRDALVVTAGFSVVLLTKRRGYKRVSFPPRLYYEIYVHWHIRTML